MLTDEIKRKVDMLNMYEWKTDLIEHPKLTDLFLEVTSRCNAKCEHCGSSCGERIPKDEIEYEYLEKTLKEIDERYGAKNVFLNVTGGEPLLRKDLFDLMKYAVSLGYRWGITTNGMLITKSMAKKIGDAGMYSVSVSIDGMKETHEAFRKVPGSFNKILKGIKYLQETPSVEVVQVTTVANKKNLHELEDIYQLLLKLGIHYWRVVNCDPIGRAKKNSEILLDEDGFNYIFNFIQEKNKEGKMVVTYGCSHYLGSDLERHVRRSYFFCRTGIMVASILSNGDIYVCPNVERRKELIQGNIRKDSFVEVWENRYEQFRKKRVTTNKKCKSCSEWKFCGGDALHTWNMDENEPNICLKNMLKEERKQKELAQENRKKEDLSYDEKFFQYLIESGKEYKIDKDLMTTVLAETYKKIQDETKKTVC